MLNSKNKSLIFVGGQNDILWRYEPADKFKLRVTAQSPYEVVHFCNGEVLNCYKNTIFKLSSKIKGKQCIYFVNEEMRTSGDWKLPNRLRCEDNATGKLLDIGMNGNFSFHISNGKNFITNLTDKSSSLTSAQLCEKMKTKLYNVLSEKMPSFFENEIKNLDNLESFNKNIADAFLPKLNDSFLECGITIDNFCVLGFNQPPVYFAGEQNDILLRYEAIKNCAVSIVAESPYEVIHFKNGKVENCYKNALFEFCSNEKDVDRIYFLNVTMSINSLWGLPEKLEYKDISTGRIVEIGIRGNYSFHINNSQLFIEKVSGTRARINSDELSAFMKPKLYDELSEHFLACLVEQNIKSEDLDLMKKSIGRQFLIKLNNAFSKYGIEVEEFFIEGFNKANVLKERVNTLLDGKEDFDDKGLAIDRETELLGKMAKLKKQTRDIDMDSINHEAEKRKKIAATDSDIEAKNYEVKGISYKELRDADRQDIKNAAEAEALVRGAVKPDTIIVTKKGSKKCSYCGAELADGQLFCPMCRRRIKDEI